MNTPFTYLDSAALSDVGRRRKNNEDSLVMLPEHGVFCVADGMGGAKGGEIASKTTCDMLQTEFSESQDTPFAITAKAGARLAARAVNRASQWIKAHAEEHGLTGCGSTAVMLIFDQVDPAKACVLHAGDSRAYRIRNGKLRQLSADHSVAAAAGVADDKDLPAMFRGVITRAVGLDSSVKLEETPVDVQAEDMFLLCSDGLSKMISDKQMQKLLHRHRCESIADLTRRLIDKALHAGGEDNVSVVLIRVSETLPQAPTRTLPPETLALEASDSAEPDTTSEVSDTDAPTRDTSQTVDTAGHLDPTHATTDSNGLITPPTPFSSPGITPEISAQHFPASTSEQHRQRILLILGVLLLIAVLITVVIFILPGIRADSY